VIVDRATDRLMQLGPSPVHTPTVSKDAEVKYCL